MNVGDVVELEPEDYAAGGLSVARHDGMVVFIRGAVPGDRTRVRLTKLRKQFFEGETVEILRRSEVRVPPPCQHFGECGGCTWQHISYEAQLAFKQRQVSEALKRIGGFEGVEVQPVLPSNDAFYYRNKMEFSFGNRWLQSHEMSSEAGVDRRALGLHRSGWFDRVVDVLDCRLQSATSAGIVNAVREFMFERDLAMYNTRTHTGYLRHLVIRQSAHTGEMMVNLVTSEDRPELMQALCARLTERFREITTFINSITARKAQVAIGDEERVYHGPGWITDRIGRNIYRISANSFFQTNTKQAERLYETVKEMAELREDDILWDLYSGTGTIAIHLADSVRRVVGIESSASAVEDARRNAASSGTANCTFVQGDLKDRLLRETEWRTREQSPSVVVTDPPRSGMHAKVVGELVRIRPERIVYVSCNPATQARDLKILCAQGVYAMTRVQPVDMFPHTDHIENVVALHRQSQSSS